MVRTSGSDICRSELGWKYSHQPQSRVHGGGQLPITDSVDEVEQIKIASTRDSRGLVADAEIWKVLDFIMNSSQSNDAFKTPHGASQRLKCQAQQHKEIRDPRLHPSTLTSFTHHATKVLPPSVDAAFDPAVELLPALSLAKALSPLWTCFLIHGCSST